MNVFNLDDLKSLIPTSTKLYFSTDLTSQINNHRQIIRAELLSALNDLKADNSNNNVLDLSQMPTTEHTSISISHCRNASGFILASKDYSIGLDLEVADRVSDKLITRISVAGEVTKTPKPHYLLSAKESAWKATNQSHSIPTISHIETMKWTTVTQNWSTYNIAFNGQSLNGIGFLTKQSGLYISFFISPSTFV